MKIRKGQKLRIVCQRKGTYNAVAIKAFDTEKDDWYPVALDQDLLYGLANTWGRGENIPCRQGATVTVVRKKKPRKKKERNP